MSDYSSLAAFAWPAVQSLPAAPLRLPEASVWRLAGVRSGPDGVREPLRAQGTLAIARAHTLLQPRALWTLLPIDALDSDGVRLAGGHRLRSATLSELLQGASWVAAALVTIGGALEDALAQLADAGEVLEAMLLDAAGSAAVGEAADAVRDAITAAAQAHGLEVGPSLAPGATYWPLEDQQVFFDLLPASTIDVLLGEGYFIHPLKSETFVLGLGADLAVKDRPGAACRYCGRAVCQFREG